MSALRTLLAADPSWLRRDGGDGIVICSRVRLARNLADERFPSRLDHEQQERLLGRLIERVPPACGWEGAICVGTGSLSEAERQVLLERRLVSTEFCKAAHPMALVARPDGGAAVMLNEEDHLRLQIIRSGGDLGSALEEAVALDRRLEAVLPYAADQRYGYLTSCPTNAGTGLRAGVMLHLPALAESDELPRAMRAVGKLHLADRGLHGEGSESIGHFHQISNQRTMGSSEEETIVALQAVIAQVIRYELLARESLLGSHRTRLEDRVFRALGLLRFARRLSSKELIDQAAWLRLGAALGMLPEGPGLGEIDRCVLHAQPGHLICEGSAAADARDRDSVRAALVRRELLGA